MSSLSLLHSAAQQTASFCRQHHLTLAIAESCTGGMVASALTDISGISEVFLGSAVTYSNQAKHAIIGVTLSTINNFGAVSEQTAKEMALGARHVFRADIAASITGIAGPDGGTADKPVGTVHIAATNGHTTLHHHCLFSGDRAAIRLQSAVAALELLQQLPIGSGSHEGF